MGQGAFIFSCEGCHLTPEEESFFTRADPWGFILFARNIQSPTQLRALTAQLRQSVGRDAPILIDQEGGRVERMRAPHWRQWMPPADHVTLAGANAARCLWLRYRIIGEELRDVGIDCNCAPLADIATRGTHPVLANRCYGTGAVNVITRARAVADGLSDAGVLPVLKHIPGQGRAVMDSHHELPVVDAAVSELQATDFAAFAALADLPMAMTAHVVYQGIDQAPATTSLPIIDMIRDDIGFEGLLMTDDISMQALDGSLPDRVRASLAAGCDVVLHCNGDLEEMHEVLDVAGRMSEPAQVRAVHALAARRAVQDVDIAALEAEQRALLGGSAYV